MKDDKFEKIDRDMQLILETAATTGENVEMLGSLVAMHSKAIEEIVEQINKFITLVNKGATK